MFLRLMQISLFVVGLIALVAAPRWLFKLRFAERVYEPADYQAAPPHTAIVFGAGLRRDGRPTTVLADRIHTAVDLYRQGHVDQILMSGTRSDDGYDEPAAMRQFALNLGIPEQAILEDGGGTRTIETCRRGLNTFGLSSAVLVTQRYHLPRALGICAAIGLEADGVAADRRVYRAERYWRLREVPATFVALLEATFFPRGLAHDSQLVQASEIDGS